MIPIVIFKPYVTKAIPPLMAAPNTAPDVAPMIEPSSVPIAKQCTDAAIPGAAAPAVATVSTAATAITARPTAIFCLFLVYFFTN